ncbi:MAG: DNA primase [Candidatus Omnitrophica bacterium]|nr:DNA primase [Candidatus Omnitrophota bacterium]
MSIPQETLDQIQERVDIVEVISVHLPLKRAGRNFRASCPFHHEKTPSFMVSPEKQIFHCFGCGEGGDVFRFLMKMERIEFLDAVRSLAEKVGIPLPKRGDASTERASESVRLYEANALAQSYYRECLLGKEGEEARRYFSNRGLEAKTIEVFQLGYAPSSPNAFLTRASSKGFSEQVLLRAGLILKGEDGRLRDRFRHRLMFPIGNVKGRVLGFGGRILDQGEPKYLNSPETEIYSKGRELYGLSLSGKWIREKEMAIVVEGYMDLITLFQAGVQPVVSTLGTSFTREQARLLKRHTHDVVVVFDPDQAGEAASLRGLDLLLEEDLSVRVVTLPGVDPDDFVRKKGSAACWKEIDGAKPLIPYRLDRLASKISLKTPEGKAKACQEILPSIAKIGNAVLRSEYIRELGERLSLKQEDLLSELKKVKEPSWGKEKEIPGKNIQTPPPPAEVMLLQLLLVDEKWIPFVWERLETDELSDGRTQKILSTLYERSKKGEKTGVARLARELREIMGGGFFSEFIGDSLDLLDKEKALTDCVLKIKATQKIQRLDQLEDEIRQAERSKEEGRLKALMEEFLAVKRGVVLTQKTKERT